MTSGPPSQDGILLYYLPPAELLPRGPGQQQPGPESFRVAEAVHATLREFGVDAQVTKFTKGPVFTCFEIELGPGADAGQVTALGSEIAYAAGHPDTRIAPRSSGRPGLELQVPNRKRQTVHLGDVLRSHAAKSADHPMAVGIGQDIEGGYVVADLAKMPNLLVAGAPGSGTSTVLHSMITSLLMRTTPDEVRLVLIDSQRVELACYEGIPHLITPVITTARKAAQALEWAAKEMDLRYREMARFGFKRIDDLNAAVRAGQLRTVPGGDRVTGFPYLLVVVDDVADVLVGPDRTNTENLIQQLTRSSRTTGIHLVMATHRLTPDVLTPPILQSLPSRMVLTTAFERDSQLVLECPDAHHLLSPGDALFLPMRADRPLRVQAALSAPPEN